MIKKLLSLVVVLLMVGTVTVSAQNCVPDPQYTLPGIYPDSATNLPCAVVGDLYNAIITVVLPVDTLTEFPAGSGNMVTVNIDSIKVEDTPGGSSDPVSGLPTNIVYACAPASCGFPGSSTGCLLLTGVPVLADTGVHMLVVELVAYVSDPQSGLGLPSADLNSIDYYSIVIVDDISKCPAVGVSEMNGTSIGILKNVPNPFEGNTSVQFTLQHSGKVEFQVHNLLGSLVYSEQIFGNVGLNKFIFSSKGLDAGVYLYTLNDGSSVATGRMVVSE